MKKILSLALVACMCFTMLAAFVGCGPSCTHAECEVLESTTATCLEGGIETYSCSNCGEKGISTKEVEAYGHIYNDTLNYDSASGTYSNVKCEFCDLLKYNVEIGEIPETITVYRQSQGKNTLVAEMTVNDVSWYLSGSYINVKVTVTPTTLATNVSAMVAIDFVGSKNEDSPKAIGAIQEDWNSRVDEATTLVYQIRREDNNIHDEQFSYTLELYENFVYNEPLGFPEMVSGTLAKAAE